MSDFRELAKKGIGVLKDSGHARKHMHRFIDFYHPDNGDKQEGEVVSHSNKTFTVKSRHGEHHTFKYHHLNEETQMTRFIDLATNKNAADFQNELEQRLSEKAGEALDARKAQIASSLFGEEMPVSEETITELSKKTLGSYTKKAADDFATQSATMVTSKSHSKEQKEAVRKFVRRGIGINRSTHRLAK